jgi:hypothetical protein
MWTLKEHSVYRIQKTQDRYQLWTLVKTVTNIQGSLREAGMFLTSWRTQKELCSIKFMGDEFESRDDDDDGYDEDGDKQYTYAFE